MVFRYAFQNVQRLVELDSEIGVVKCDLHPRVGCGEVFKVSLELVCGQYRVGIVPVSAEITCVRTPRLESIGTMLAK